VSGVDVSPVAAPRGFETASGEGSLRSHGQTTSAGGLSHAMLQGLGNTYLSCGVSPHTLLVFPAQYTLNTVK